MNMKANLTALVLSCLARSVTAEQITGFDWSGYDDPGFSGPTLKNTAVRRISRSLPMTMRGSTSCAPASRRTSRIPVRA